jgi:hypothetical protein
MKDLIIVFAFIILLIVALKVLFWTAATVLPVALAAAAIYIGVRLLIARRRGAS